MPHLPLLAVDDAGRLARTFFRRELVQLDMTPVFARSLDDDEAARRREELDHRMGELAVLDEDAEHRALGVEIGLLIEEGFRSPYDSRASVH